MAGGLEAAYRRELEAADDPVALRAEIARAPGSGQLAVSHGRALQRGGDHRSARHAAHPVRLGRAGTRAGRARAAQRSQGTRTAALSLSSQDSRPPLAEAGARRRRRRRRGRAGRGDGWTEAHVRRLFWRAGFGATPREARAGRGAGKRGDARLAGQRRTRAAGRASRRRSVDGKRSTPSTSGATTSSGGSTAWSARTQPLQEKMTLFWHDHFATSRPGHAADAGAEPHAAPPRARPLPHAAARDHDAIRRCCCSSRWPTRTRRRPNENFARELMELFTLGARLHRARHPRGRARAHRLPGRLARRRERAHLLRPRAPRPGAQAHLRRARALRLEGRAQALRAPIPRTRRSWSRSSGITSSRTPPPRATRRALAATYRRSGHRIKPLLAEILAHPALYREPRQARTWSSRRSSSSPARCARAARNRPRLVGLAAQRHGPAALPPAVGRGLGLGPGLDVVELDAPALRRRQLLLDTSARQRGGRARSRRPRARRGGGARPARSGRPVDLTRRPTPSCCASHVACSTTARSVATAAGASPSSSAPTCASARCATCSSPAPTPSSTDARPSTAPATTSTAARRRPRRDYLGGARADAPPGARPPALGAGLALYAAKAMPFTQVFEAAAADAAAAPDAPVLVSVFLPGGVDLLDTLVPAARLRRATPTCSPS